MGRRDGNSANQRDSRTRPLYRGGAAGEQLGRALEQRVEEALQKMVWCRKLDNYTRHERNSYQDRHGKDFTVERDRQHRSFGVIASSLRAIVSRSRHPVPVLHISPGAPVAKITQEFVNALLLSPLGTLIPDPAMVTRHRHGEYNVHRFWNGRTQKDQPCRRDICIGAARVQMSYSPESGQNWLKCCCCSDEWNPRVPRIGS